MTVGTRKSWEMNDILRVETKDTVVDQEGVQWEVSDEKTMHWMVPRDRKDSIESQEHLAS